MSPARRKKAAVSKKKTKPVRRGAPRATLGTVVFERELEGIQPDGKRIRVAVRFGRPTRGGPKAPWGCPVVFHGFDTRVYQFFGADSFQAVHLALESARATLEALARARGVTLRYLGMPGHGMPRVPTREDGYEERLKLALAERSSQGQPDAEE